MSQPLKKRDREHPDYSDTGTAGHILSKMRQFAVDILDEQYSSEGDFTIYDLRGQRQPSTAFSKQLYLLRNNELREVLHSFMGREHKLEPCRTAKGIEYIDDSKSTNRNSLRFALEMMKKPTVLIMGGQSQTPNPPDDIYDLMHQTVKGIVALGKDNERVRNAFSKHIPVISVRSMDDAVKAANSMAKTGDIVLLSPAAASFDLFTNYEDRGNQFKEAVRNL